MTKSAVNFTALLISVIIATKLTNPLNNMRIPRIYHPTSLENQQTCQLSDDAANHVGRVLRMQVGEQIELFDGSNHIYLAIITQTNKKAIEVNILSSTGKS